MLSSRYCLMTITSPSFKKICPAIIVALIITMACGYYVCGKDDICPVIDKKVYRSGQLEGHQLEQAIKVYGLKTIFNLRGENGGSEWYDNEKRIAESNGVALHNFPFNASALPNVMPLLALLDRLETARMPLLVHCHHGADRTSFVSALVLALQDDVAYETAVKQISWRFGVLPGKKSAGPLFFDQYESWLRETGIGHNPEVLRTWIRQDYIDGNGSISYSVDTVEGIVLKRDRSGEERSATLPSGLPEVTVAGWAYDRRHHKRMENVTVGLGNTFFAPAVFLHPRPDVARFLNVTGGDRGGHSCFGWSARFDGKDLKPGSYRITLHFTTSSGRTVTIPTGCVIHIA